MKLTYVLLPRVFASSLTRSEYKPSARTVFLSHSKQPELLCGRLHKFICRNSADEFVQPKIICWFSLMSALVAVLQKNISSYLCCVPAASAAGSHSCRIGRRRRASRCSPAGRRSPCRGPVPERRLRRRAAPRSTSSGRLATRAAAPAGSRPVP